MNDDKNSFRNNLSQNVKLLTDNELKEKFEEHNKEELKEKAKFSGNEIKSYEKLLKLIKSGTATRNDIEEVDGIIDNILTTYLKSVQEDFYFSLLNGKSFIDHDDLSTWSRTISIINTNNTTGKHAGSIIISNIKFIENCLNIALQDGKTKADLKNAALKRGLSISAFEPEKGEPAQSFKDYNVLNKMKEKINDKEKYISDEKENEPR